MIQRSRFYRSIGFFAVLLTLPLLAMAAPQDPAKQQMFAVEHALAAAGFTINSADGEVDDSTRQAIRAFQEQQPGLKVTGEVGEAMLVALGVNRESKYDRAAAAKAAAAVKPSYDPTKNAAPAGKAGTGEALPEETETEAEDDGWLFTW